MSAHSLTNKYLPPLSELVQPRLMALGPGRPVEEKRAALAQLRPEALCSPGQTLRDESAAHCCLAGLWLLYDFLEECHRICQTIPTAEGSYWHALMHRREPDEDNSKYWFRRVGQHPIFPALAQHAAECAARLEPLPAEASWLRSGPTWDPFRFVDLCAAVRDTGTPLETVCQQIQLAEWQLLFEYCYARAVGVSV
ncbi:MAG: hypothetical protein RMI91_06845 [Gemmatales bacterium]|nr:hypothetical protein [Gemmatales bacterium]MDW7994354.1 hypothetical protein [Gemmatales bacterium]